LSGNPLTTQGTVLIQEQSNLAWEWEELCKWFKGKAAQAVSRTSNAESRESILHTVAALCRDEPPKTIEGFNAFRRFAEAYVGLWETNPLPDTDRDTTISESRDTARG
jgi:hypothetical protein